MATTLDPAVRKRLESDIASIGRDGPAPHTVAPPPPVAADELEPFGRWLLAQKSRGDWIDDLAAAARKDPGFPKLGDPEDVRKRMQALGVGEADVFEQIDDAERCWLSC
jgi:hypothetical protein